MKKQRRRCPWPTFDDPLYLRYHDKEWGAPVHAVGMVNDHTVACFRHCDPAC